MHNIRLYLLTFFIVFAALSVSASAAYYSITGLSKLFAGASFEVKIMATSLEISKLVIASVLYQYWDVFNKILRSYLSAALFVLIVITSVGIYGFLSSAYQETANKSGIVDYEIQLINTKKERFKKEVTFLLEEKNALINTITELNKGLSNNVISYIDKKTGQKVTTTSNKKTKALREELAAAKAQRDSVSLNYDAAIDSLNLYEVQLLNAKSNNDLAGELGPLKYVSDLTGKDMDVVINVLLLIIIFVFDPLAISLVIAANVVVSNINREVQKNTEDDKENNEQEENVAPVNDDISSFLAEDIEEIKEDVIQNEEESENENLTTETSEEKNEPEKKQRFINNPRFQKLAEKILEKKKQNRVWRL